MNNGILHIVLSKSCGKSFTWSSLTKSSHSNARWSKKLKNHGNIASQIHLSKWKTMCSLNLYDMNQIIRIWEQRTFLNNTSRGEGAWKLREEVEKNWARINTLPTWGWGTSLRNGELNHIYTFSNLKSLFFYTFSNRGILVGGLPV